MSKTSRALCVGCLLLAVLSLGLKPTSHAQDAARPGVNPSGPLVGLSLIVTDEKNDPIHSISKDEIVVIENKVVQKILSVEPDERPVEFGILIDSSGSFRRLLASALEAARLIVDNRRPADEIFVERFISSTMIETVQDFTTDGDALIEGLKGFKVGEGQSAVIDALYLAADHLATHSKIFMDRRKVIVIITDGEDRNSFYNVEAVIKLLREEGIQVFVLGLIEELDRHRMLTRVSTREKAEKLLQSVAAESGGRVFFPKDKNQLTDSTLQIIGYLRAQFRITYQSTNNNSKKGFRKVQVKLISPNGEKRHAIVPRGYYVGAKPTGRTSP